MGVLHFLLQEEVVSLSNILTHYSIRPSPWLDLHHSRHTFSKCIEDDFWRDHHNQWHFISISILVVFFALNGSLCIVHFPSILKWDHWEICCTWTIQRLPNLYDLTLFFSLLHKRVQSPDAYRFLLKTHWLRIGWDVSWISFLLLFFLSGTSVGFSWAYDFLDGDSLGFTFSSRVMLQYPNWCGSCYSEQDHHLAIYICMWNNCHACRKNWPLFLHSIICFLSRISSNSSQSNSRRHDNVPLNFPVLPWHMNNAGL